MLEVGDVGHDRERQAALNCRGFQNEDVDHPAVAALELYRHLDARRHGVGLDLALFVVVARFRQDKTCKFASDDLRPFVSGRGEPVVADGRDAIVLVEREEHCRRQVIGIRRAAVRALQFLLLALELDLHVVEAAGEPPHFVVGLPVDVVAGAELPGRLDRIGQTHQRLDHEDAVADQRGTEDSQNREDEDRDEDDLFMVQAVEQAERRIEDGNGAEVFRSTDRIVEDGPRDRFQLAAIGFRDRRLGDVELAGGVADIDLYDRAFGDSRGADLRDAVFVEVPERLCQRLGIGDQQDGNMILYFLVGALGRKKQEKEEQGGDEDKQCAADYCKKSILDGLVHCFRNLWRRRRRRCWAPSFL